MKKNVERLKLLAYAAQNIKELLTARALAFWIADDGGISSYKATILNTDSFTLDQLNLLQQALLDNFNLRTRLAEKRPGQWIIVIPIKQPIPLYEIVGPYLHSSSAKREI